MGRRAPSRKIMLRPPIAAVHPPQGKLHGNRPQDRSDRRIGRHGTNLILRSKSLAKVSGGSSGPPVTPTPDQQESIPGPGSAGMTASDLQGTSSGTLAK